MNQIPASYEPDLNQDSVEKSRDTQITLKPGSLMFNSQPPTANSPHSGLQNCLGTFAIYLWRLTPACISALITLLICLLWLWGHSPLYAAGRLHYVSPTGVDSTNCSLGNPCLTIQKAIDNAGSGDEIRVAAGTYAESISINKSLSLRGGFTTTNWVIPDPDSNTTTIKPVSGRVIYVNGSNIQVTVNGFHLTGGNLVTTDPGAGVYNENGTLILENNRIYNNYTIGSGGGIAQDTSSNLILRNSKIYSNTAANGGGISILAGTATIEANQIFSNTVTSFGGGIFITGVGSDVTIKNNLIYTNTSVSNGGGVFFDEGSLNSENNTLYDNRADIGGGLMAFSGIVTITNNLVISNTATDVNYGGGGIFSNTNISIISTDFFGNSPNELAKLNSSPPPDGVSINPTTIGTGNRISDPLFVNPSAYNLHLSAGSPAIDSGAITTTATSDYEGHARPYGLGIDRGADEYIVTSDCYARIQGGQVYTNVQQAVDNANSGNTIQVAGYCKDFQTRLGLIQTVYISQNLTVRGGYTVTDWVTPQYQPTVLDADQKGRVIYITNTADVTLENLHITNGNAGGSRGGGVYLGHSGNATLQNNVIYKNQTADDGGGIYIDGSGGQTTLQHNTVYSNTAGDFGGGVYAHGSSGPITLRHTLIVDNFANTGGGIASSAGGKFGLSYNDFYGNSNGDYNGGSLSSTDLTNPPGFEDPANGDFHLDYATSLVINVAPDIISSDFENDDRPQGSQSDIGADESLFYVDVLLSTAPESPKVVTDTAPFAGSYITFTHTITNISTAAPTGTFVIDITNSDNWDVITTNLTSPAVLTVGVPLTFKVVVSVPVSVSLPIFNRTNITATAQTNSAIFATVEDIIATPGLALTPSFTENADPGEVLTYTHILSNTGPITDTFNVTINTPQGWGVQIVPTPSFTVSVGPGAATPVVIRVTVPATAPVNMADIMTVTATSIGFGVSASVTDTTTANATTGDRYVATNGSNINNNCKEKSAPCQTIIYAVNQAAWGDAINVRQGEYDEPGGIFLNQPLILQGGWNAGFTGQAADPTNTTINVQNSGRGIRIQVPAPFQPMVNNFTIKNATSSGVGGGIYVQGNSVPTLTNLIILDSSASRGGGIYIDSGNPIVENVAISNTTASGRGGGIYVGSGSPLLVRVGITNSTAVRGGGIYQAGGNLTGRKLTVNQNSASDLGGGIYQAGGTLLITQTRVSSNTAPTGGGFYNQSGNMTLQNNFIYSNTATTDAGGGVYNNGALSMINNTLYSNHAGTFGGGIFDNNTGGLVISNTIIVVNSAGTSGGGLYRSSGVSVPADIDYNNVWGNSPDPGNVSPGPNSISADPLFVNAAGGDLHLTANSPAVDTAAPDTPLETDIDDDFRPVNQGFDIGADELSGCLARVKEAPAVIYGVVQEAIDAATNGQTVQVSGTCWGVQPQVVNGQTISQTAFISKNLTVKGGYNSTFSNNPDDSPKLTILDALGRGRVVVVTDSVVITISTITLVNGNAANQAGNAGGGIYLYDGTLNLERTTITNSQATYGGGLYSFNGNFVGGDVEAKRTYVLSNTATEGGGIYLEGGAPSVTYITLRENSASEGGGIYNRANLGTISQTTLYSNTATTNGGGVYNNAAGALYMVNTIAASNTAVTGGGLYNLSNNLTLRHNTFYGNSANSEGGGIYHSAGTSAAIINSTIIANNAASTGGGIFRVGTDPQFNFNDVVGNTGGDYGGMADQTGTNNNISVDPGFVSFNPVTNNFLRLSNSSQVQDKGDPGSPVIVDIDDDPRPSNQYHDIGADEIGGCYARINGNPPTYGSVQLAVNKSSPGDEIRVAGTCYGVTPAIVGGQPVSQTMIITQLLTVQGGYTVTNDLAGPSNPDTNPTILNAGNLGRVAYITNSAVITIKGLHLRNGQETNGGGIFVGSGTLTMTHNWIYSNTASKGGAIYNQAGNVYLHGDNQLDGTDNEIYNNTAAEGGAIYNAGGQITVDDNTLRHNQATSGGAFYHAAGASLLQNNIIRENQAADGGGIYNAGIGLTVRHNTVYSNTATNGGGFYTTNTAPVVVNTIFATNTATTGHAIFSNQATFTPSYNDAYPAANAYNGNVSPSNSLTVEPGFADPAANDFHLRQDSLLLDQGDPGMTLYYDFDGPNYIPAGPHTRPGDQGFDIGADERPSCLAKVMSSGIIYGNIQLAVNHSIPDDTIRVTAEECRGVHPFDTGSDIISQTVHITHNLTLNGGYNGSFSSRTGKTTLMPMSRGRAMLITGTTEVTITNFILTTGDAAGLSGNTGGGIYTYNGGQVTLEDVEVFSNTAAYGGGIHNNDTTLIIEGSEIYENIAQQGGGIYHNTGLIVLTDTTQIFANQAEFKGGGIYNNSQIILENTEIYTNHVIDGSGEGGGFYNASGHTATLDLNVRLYDNSANKGGAIYHAGGDNLTVWNTFVYSNTGNQGAGFYLAAGNSDIVHDTFYANKATSEGGAIYHAAITSTIKNNIFAKNTASTGSAVYGAAGAGADLDYNNYSPAGGPSQVAGSVSAGGNRSDGPPFFTNEADADLSLDPDFFSISAAVDRGDHMGVPRDFEEEPRPINQRPDMGADEANDCLARLSSTGFIYGQIQTAIDAANPVGDKIDVAEGRCYENVNIPQNIIIEGSWEKDFSGKVNFDGVEYIATYIDGTNNDRVINITNGADGTVDLSWMYLINGQTSGDGGAIRSDATLLKLTEMSMGVWSFWGNSATGNGGGVYIAAGKELNWFNTSAYANVAGGQGGGLYLGNGSKARVSGGGLYENRADTGGGIYSNQADLTIYNLGIQENEASVDYGGGIYLNGSAFVATNLLLYNNTAASRGGGIYRDGSSGSAKLYHNTINANHATANEGGGVYNSGSSMVISASIVSANTHGVGGTGNGVYGAANVNVAYTLRAPDNTYNGVTPGAGNINDQDPRFLTVDGSRILYNSPALDGVPIPASDVPEDIVVDPRPSTPSSLGLCKKDMGVDEYIVGKRKLSWSGPSPSGTVTLPPTESVTYTYVLTNASENWTAYTVLGSLSSRGPGTGYTETVTITLNSTQNWSRIVAITGGVNPVIISDTQATVDLGLGDVVSISVKVTVPAGTFADVEDKTHFTTSAQQCPEQSPQNLDASATATTKVEQSINFTITPDNFGAALPGQSITYTHIISNVGNITDTYLIFPKPGFYATVEISEPISFNTGPVGPGQVATVVLTITINANASPGLVDVSNLIARSTHKDGTNQEKAAADNTTIGVISGTRYVSLEGLDSTVDESELVGTDFKDNNCTQPDIGACRTIQHAIEQAVAGDEIRIAEGNYTVVLTDIITSTYKGKVITQVAFVDKSVTLRGGYNTDNWDENPPNHISQTTTLDLQGLGRGIYVTAGITPTTPVTIDRLTIVNGNAVGLGGGPSGEDAGGNIYNEGSTVILHANRIWNGAAQLGGGLYSANGDLLLQNNMLHHNTAITDGGAINVDNGTATLENNTLYNNQATFGVGGGLNMSNGSLIITNTIFATNTATDGGAVYAPSVTPALDYNLYYGNSADQVEPVAISATTTVFLTDPVFVNPADSPPDLHLESASPARDTGSPATTLNIDYDNDLRPLGPAFDIGADERIPVQRLTFVTDTYTSTLAGAIIVITHTLQNTGDITDDITITASGTYPWATFDQTIPYTITLGSGLSTTVVVTYTVPFTAVGQTNVTIITATSSLTTVFDTVRDEIKVKGAAWEITKTADPAVTVQPGQSLTYTLTITNSGDLTATLTYTITDELPNDTNFVSATSSPILTSPVTWELNTNIGISQSITVSYVVTVTKPLTHGTAIVNQTYSITGGGAPTGTVGAPVTVWVDSPATLTATKTANTSLVEPGGYLTYTITITNDASALGPALGVTVTDILPAEAVLQQLGFVPPATGIANNAGNNLTWQLTNPIQPGDFAQVTASVRITSPLAAQTILTNTFSVTANNLAAVVSGTITTPVTATNIITLHKTAVPTTVVSGGTVTYTITLTNEGNGIATVTLTDTLGPAFNSTDFITTVTVPGGTWTSSSGAATVSFTATAPLANGIYYNRAITATYDISQTTLADTAPISVGVATVDFSSPAYSINEAAGTAVITVALSAPSGLTVTVEYSTTDNTALAGSDYVAASNVLTFAPGTTVMTFTVSITDDTLFEGNETLTLNLGNPNNAALANINNPATLTIIENDPQPTVDFSSPNYSVDEEAGTATITVTLSAVSDVTATVQYATSDNTATDGSDYTGVTDVLTFTPGITEVTFTVTILSDTLYEGNETLNLTLSGAISAATGTANNPATLTIIDNESAPTVDFETGNYSVDEDQGPAVITVTLSAVSGVTATVQYATSDNTATSAADYASTNGTLTFSPGITTVTFTVSITDDALFEGNETLTLTLSGEVSATLGTARNPATLTIIEDDPQPTVAFDRYNYSVDEDAGAAVITVTLSSASDFTATVTYSTTNGSATAGSDYVGVTDVLTFAPGATLLTFTVSITDDLNFEPDETITLTLSSAISATLGATNPATLTIVDNDITTVSFEQANYSVDENTTPAVITVTLAAISNVTVTVAYSTTDNTATAGSDYVTATGTLTFTPGQTQTTFPVTINDDFTFEGDETLILTLGDVNNATLGATNPATLTIIENDPPPSVNFESSSYSVDEDKGPAVITVTLSAASVVTTTVDYAGSDNTATAGSDYATASGTITFTPGITVITFTVSIIDDGLFENDETLNLTLSNPNNATIGATNPATLTIVDNDPMPVVDFQSNVYTVTESAGTATITVTLSAASGLTATVQYATSDNTATASNDYVAATGIITFTPGQTQTTFSVTITDDAVFEGDEALTLTLNSPVSATLVGATNNPAALIITDNNDRPIVDFSSNNYSVYENGGPALITVTLTGSSNLTTTVTYSTANNTATAGSDYVGVTDVLTFAPGITVLTFTVTITNDGILEGSETLTLTLSNPTSATLGTANNPAVLTIIDDDAVTVDFSSSNYVVDESVGMAVITLTLSASAIVPVQVDYATGDNTAIAGSDYATASGTLTFAPTITQVTFTVTITDDSLYETTEALTLTLSNPISLNIGSTNPAALTITDNDPAPELGFSAANYSVSEGIGTATITVTLSAVSGITATVSYATNGITATPGNDYGIAVGGLTFPPGTTVATFTVAIYQDASFEGNETVSLTLFSPVSATIGITNPVILTIVDDDPLPTVQFSSSAYSVNENTGAGTATITVTLSAASAVTATVDYATSDLTATAGVDYIAAAGTLTFTPGITELTFTVSITDDALFEGNETVSLTLSNQISATLGLTNPAILTIIDDESMPTIQFSSNDYTVDESAGTATITVTLSAVAGITATVNYATSDLSATAGADYTAVNNTLVFTPGVTTATFSIPITDDATYEGNETVSLTLSLPVSATIGATNPATLTIIDNDTPVIDYSSSAYTVDEGAGTAIITVTLTPASPMIATVSYSTTNNTATAGSDYVGVTGVLTFTPGATWMTFTISITEDLIIEGSETLTLTLFSPVSATLGSANNPAVLTIIDNDAQTAEFSASGYTVDESVGTAIITVTLSGASSVTATVDYATGDNTATAGSDYVASSGTLTFTPGITTVTFTVSITDDGIFETNEIINLTLSNPISANIGGVNPATLTITDNDSATINFSSSSYSVDENTTPAIITVTLSNQAAMAVTVNYTTGDLTATAGDDYAATGGVLTFTPGITVMTFTVSITDDTTFEGNETISLTLSNPSPISITLGATSAAILTIIEDDTEPEVYFSQPNYSVDETAGTATITVTLSAASTVTTTVNYNTADLSATAGSDYVATGSVLTFTPGITVMTFTVSINDDGIFEGNETISLTLSGPINATLGTTNTAILTIIDDDTQPEVNFSQTNYSVDESAGTATITVTLSAASAITAAVNYSATDLSATAGSDYVATSSVLTFTPGITTLTFTVSISDDTIFEGNETISLTLSGPISATLGTTNTAILTIVDDDIPRVSFSSPTYSVNETETTATITVTLSPASAVTATVNYNTTDLSATAGSDYVATSSVLTFTPGITTLTFTVSISDDSIFEGNETISLTLSNPNPISVTLGATSTAILTIIDDETQPEVYFSQANYSVNENTTPAIITVTLSTASGITTTVNYAATDITATSGNDYAATNGTLTFNPGVTEITFTVSIINDTLLEPNETISLTLSSPVSATLGVTNTAILTIINDDPLPRVEFSAADYSVDESGGSATITVTLTPASGITATVNYNTSNVSATAGSDYVAATGVLTFNPGTTAMTFTVSITDDLLVEGDETLGLTLSGQVSATLIGATNPATLTIVDNDAAAGLPILIAPANGTLTNTGAITFVWSRASNAVSYTLHLSASTYNIPDPGSGTTVVSPALLADGVYTWTVEAFNINGISSGITATWTFTVDTQAPSVPIPIYPLTGEVVLTNTVPFTWNISNDTLSGVVSYTIIVTNSSGVQVASATVSGTSTNLVLIDGVYTWTVQAIDAAGNISAPGGPEQFTVDGTLPARPTLISPPNPTYTNNPSVTFIWSATADTVTYTLKVSNTLYNVLAPTTSYTPPPLPEGIYLWTVQAVDAYSRTLGYTDTWQVIVDVTPPEAPTLNLPANGAVISTTNPPTFDWSDSSDNLSGPVTYTIIITSGSGTNTYNTNTTSDFTPGSSLPSGVYTWTVIAYDKAGNVAVSSQVFTLTIQGVSGDIYLPIILLNSTGGGGTPPPPNLPDLVVTSIITSHISGNTYSVQVIARNQSSTPVNFGNNFHINVYLTSDLTTPILVWGVQGSWFGANQTVTLPAQNYTFSSGSHTLRAWADPWNVVVESNEGNNTLDGGGLSAAGLGGIVEPQNNPAIPPGPLPTPTPGP